MSFEKDRNGHSSAAFAGALRDAINHRDVTLTWLHEQLTDRGNRVSSATLSYWRSGARRPEGPQSMAAVTDIEDILGLTRGSLTGLLRTSNRTGPLGPAHFPIDEDGLEQAVREVFAGLGATYPDTTREVTAHAVTDVDVEGNVARRVTRTIVQSTNGTVTGIPFLELTPGVRTPTPFMEAVSGGRISARFSHPSGEVHGVIFELEAPLAAPGTAMVEWSVEFPPDYPPMRETGHGVSRQCRELLVWTRFHPDALPDWCEERMETPTGVTITPMSFDGRTSIHQVRRAFGPGLIELRWGYGPRA